MCASKYAANSRLAVAADFARPSRFSSSANVGPSTARWLIASSRSSTPAKTDDPVHGNGKRAPSSFVHETATTEATVRGRVIVERAYDLERGERAIRAVEASTAGLRVEVAAKEHRGP